MADITACKNDTCKLKEKCHRYTCVKNPYGQSYAEFTPDEKGKCEYFWDNKNYYKSKQTK